MLLAAALLFVALLPPYPRGIWYFGHRPQWLVGVDHAGLSVGPSDDPVLLGWVPLLVAKLVVPGLSVWWICSRLGRRRASRPGSRGAG